MVGGLVGIPMESTVAQRKHAQGGVASLAGGAVANGTLVMVGNSGQVLERGSDGQFRASLHPSGVDFSAVLSLGNGRWLLVGEEGTHRYPAREGEG